MHLAVVFLLFRILVVVAVLRCICHIVNEVRVQNECGGKNRIVLHAHQISCAGLQSTPSPFLEALKNLSRVLAIIAGGASHAVMHDLFVLR